MKATVTQAFEGLPPERQRLLRVLQQVNHGRIYDLHIRDGQPVLDPMPRVVRTLKFPGDNGPRPEIGIQEYALKTHIVQFFACLDAMRDGVIEVLEFRDGLPVAAATDETLRLN